MTYQDIAEKVDINWCNGSVDLYGAWCKQPAVNHHKGTADIGRGCVHWFDRGVTKRGIRRFLMLVAACRLHHNRGQPRWQQIYEQSQWASAMARDKLRKTIPRSYADGDKAQVRWLLSKDKDWRGDQYKRDRAYGWARERHGV